MKKQSKIKKHSTDDEEESEQNDSDDGADLFDIKLNLDENKANQVILLSPVAKI